MSAPDAQAVLVRDEGQVTWITLNRPLQANTINIELARSFCDAVAHAESVGAHVVVITGEGRAFCGGGDIAEMTRAGDLPAYLFELASTFHSGLAHLATLDATIVAAVNGAAAGGGFGLALNADVILASHTAVFLTAYESIGLTPDCGTSFLLPRAIGLTRALALSSTGARTDAATAERLGIVAQVVNASSLNSAARQTAERISTRARGHMAATRRLYRGGEADAYRRHLDEEARSISAAARSEDIAGRIRSISERTTKEGAR